MLKGKIQSDNKVKVSDIRKGKLKTGWSKTPRAMIHSPKPKIMSIVGSKPVGEYSVEELCNDPTAPNLKDVFPEYKHNIKLLKDDCVIFNDVVYKSLKKHRTSSRISIGNTDYYKKVDDANEV